MREALGELLDLTARARLGEQRGRAVLEEIEHAAGAVLGEQRGEDRAHVPALLVEGAAEGVGRGAAAETHRTRQAQAPARVGGDPMHLPLPFHLHAILGAAQETVGDAQRFGLRTRQNADLCQRRQRALRGAVADLRNAPAVQQL